MRRDTHLQSVATFFPLTIHIKSIFQGDDVMFLVHWVDIAECMLGLLAPRRNHFDL